MKSDHRKKIKNIILTSAIFIAFGFILISFTAFHFYQISYAWPFATFLITFALAILLSESTKLSEILGHFKILLLLPMIDNIMLKAIKYQKKHDENRYLAKSMASVISSYKIELTKDDISNVSEDISLFDEQGNQIKELRKRILVDP